MSGGILVAGRLVPVPGLAVIPAASAGGPAWARLDRGDCTSRHAWVRQVIVHSTGGDWPMPITPGAGPGGECPRYADIWQTDPAHSAAHLVVDSAGTVACLADLATTTAYHAEGSNPWSVGIEMVQQRDGVVYQATIDACARLVAAICDAIGIPEQMPRGPYRGAPLARMEVVQNGRRINTGGPDVVGVLGHRDNTSQRGRGDPGDAIWTALAALGFEGVDYAGGEDLEIGHARQITLVARGEALTVDGLVGPASLAAARRCGFARWRDVPAAA
ncbi:MAG TPA: peptidoglycan recognition family protein [Mycobacterium sp.]|nr:peptidoglycan recognition family protein [Mycobacterium sp.]